LLPALLESNAQRLVERFSLGPAPGIRCATIQVIRLHRRRLHRLHRLHRRRLGLVSTRVRDSAIRRCSSATWMQ
jgi:hypothetical protein